MTAKSVPSSRNTAVGTVAARYLEVIHYVVHEGQVPRPSRLAEWLGVSAPTVTGVLHRLGDLGMLTTSPDRVPHLTAAGEGQAARIVRRHRIVERWLADELGLDWAAADEEAGPLAHHLSDRIVDLLFERMGRPSTCPHGNEIPGAGRLDRRLVSLLDLEPGVVAPISRISEVAEHEAPQLLLLLAREGLVIGEMVEVTGDGGSGAVTVHHGGRSTALGPSAASAVWVDLNQAAASARRGGAGHPGSAGNRPG